jgi:hypothetical protein
MEGEDEDWLLRSCAHFRSRLVTYSSWGLLGVAKIGWSIGRCQAPIAGPEVTRAARMLAVCSRVGAAICDGSNREP